MPRTPEEIYEDIDMLRGVLGETEAQHRSETAMFGDSWPGAQLQLERMKSHLAALQEEYAAVAPPVPPAPPVAPAPLADPNDIPF